MLRRQDTELKHINQKSGQPKNLGLWIDKGENRRQCRDPARLAHLHREVNVLKAQFPKAEGVRDIAEAK